MRTVCGLKPRFISITDDRGPAHQATERINQSEKSRCIDLQNVIAIWRE